MDQLKEFTALLSREMNVLEQLLDLSYEKQRMIITGKVTELDKLVQREGIIVSNLGKLEDARFQSQATLAQAWKIPLEDLSASVMLQKVNLIDRMLAPELRLMVESLERILKRLKEVNSQNNELLKLSLDYIEEMQFLLSGDEPGTYSDKGGQGMIYEARSPHSILDRKA